MLFLAWLAVSFLAVAAINLYLRYFGLPRRPLTSAVDGRAYYDRSAGGYMTSQTGALGGSGGGGWTAALFGAGHGSSSPETVRNSYVCNTNFTVFSDLSSGRRVDSRVK